MGVVLADLEPLARPGEVALRQTRGAHLPGGLGGVAVLLGHVCRLVDLVPRHGVGGDFDHLPVLVLQLEVDGVDVEGSAHGAKQGSLRLGPVLHAAHRLQLDELIERLAQGGPEAMVLTLDVVHDQLAAPTADVIGTGGAGVEGGVGLVGGAAGDRDLRPRPGDAAARALGLEWFLEPGEVAEQSLVVLQLARDLLESTLGVGEVGAEHDVRLVRVLGHGGDRKIKGAGVRLGMVGRPLEDQLATLEHELERVVDMLRLPAVVRKVEVGLEEAG